MWARIMRDEFGATNPKSLLMRFHSQTAGVTLQAQQPLVNVVRVAVQAMAAVLGGTQSLHTNSYDEALSLPTQGAAELALRTQQVIAHESGVADFIDPLGGSYAIEHLTDEIERRAQDYLDKIAELGGAVAAIEQGFPQREIESRAYEHQRAVENGARTVVGVNAFESEGEGEIDIQGVPPELERDQIQRLQALRSRRASAETERALGSLEMAATATDNLLPPILACVKALATVGEIADRLRTVFGEYRSPAS
jgi:methylmalonyl-CoA mutase N-terminal domain/subunit